MTTEVKKIGRIRRGWEIAKSSWNIFRLEPGLIVIEVLSLLATIAILGLFMFGQWKAGIVDTTGDEYSVNFFSPAGLLLIALFYMVLYTSYSYFTGWFSHMVYQRLDGKDPTVLGSLKMANSKFIPLAKFGIITGLFNLVFEAIRSRTSFLGDLFSFVGQMAWAVVSIFAIPIIVTSKENIGPFDAVKQSTTLIKKTWGEGVVSQFGIGIVGMLAFLAYMGISIIVTVVLIGIGSTGLGVGAAIIGGIGLLTLVVAFGLLASIAQTSLFYYAKTGKAPEAFNKELLKQAMTPKKARKIFG